MNGLTAQTPCTVSRLVHTTPCFQIAYASGKEPPPDTDSEAQLDTEWAHVTAEGADILFVEAADTTGPDFLSAIDMAVSMGASVVSMSWGTNDITAADDSHFDVSTASFVSGSGDYDCPDPGKNGLFPEASPYVLSVGGTALTITGGTSSQTAWDRSGE